MRPTVKDFSPTRSSNGLRFFEFRGRHHEQHAESHVEGAQHFFLRHVPKLLQVLKDREAPATSPIR